MESLDFKNSVMGIDAETGDLLKQNTIASTCYCVSVDGDLVQDKQTWIWIFQCVNAQITYNYS